MERFWSKVEKTETCWYWKAYIDPKGYGRFGYRGSAYAHRVAYELSRGPIPSDLTIDHLCRTRHAARNARKTHCVRGHPLSGTNLKLQGKHRLCLACLPLYYNPIARRMWKRAHREQLSAYQRGWRAKNKAHIREYNRGYWLRRKEAQQS